MAAADRERVGDNQMSRVVSWFSCGVASTVAAHMALNNIFHYGDEVVIAYCDTNSEHPDNVRFIRECEERIFNQSIHVLKSEKYMDIWDVFEKTRFLRSIHGARCTTELKKKVRQAFQKHDDVHVFGYTIDEQHRADNLAKNNPELVLSFPLIDAEMTKADCFDYFNQFGIKRPIMYDLGFNNNNCIGCVKGGKGYWNHIRHHFPDVFDRMAKLEREIGASICRDEKGNPLFLDELPPDRGVHKGLYREDLFSHAMSCDFLCGAS